MDTAAFALMKRVPSLASTAEDITVQIILRDVENGSVIFGDFVVAGHEHVTASLTASLWFGKVGCITVNSKDHVACLVRGNGLVL